MLLGPYAQPFLGLDAPTARHRKPLSLWRRPPVPRFVPLRRQDDERNRYLAGGLGRTGGSATDPRVHFDCRG
jgi:hypothetical protein